jgi:flagellar assembly factor FliW
MKKMHTGFGEITYDPEKTIDFPEGLAGFEHLRKFVVLPVKKGDVLFCIQSVEDAHVAFLLVNPALFFPDYSITAGPEDLKKLGISSDGQYFVMTTITFHKNNTATLNLLAPIIYTPETDRALQVVLDGSGYSTQTPLPVKKQK